MSKSSLRKALPYQESIIKTLQSLDFKNPLVTERAIALSELVASTYVSAEYRRRIVRSLENVRHNLFELQLRNAHRPDQALMRAVATIGGAIDSVKNQDVDPNSKRLRRRPPRPTPSSGGREPPVGHV